MWFCIFNRSARGDAEAAGLNSNSLATVLSDRAVKNHMRLFKLNKIK